MSGRLDPDLERLAQRVADLLATRAAVAEYLRRKEKRAELVAAVAAHREKHPEDKSRAVSLSRGGGIRTSKTSCASLMRLKSVSQCAGRHPLRQRRSRTLRPPLILA